MQTQSTRVSLIEEDAVKKHKHILFQSAAEVFIHNIKQFIAIEGTQKKLAKGIGVSEELLSKYKSGDAFPAIETLMVLAERYSLTLDQLLKEKLYDAKLSAINHKRTVDGSIGTASDVPLETSMFSGGEMGITHNYYVYFYVTNVHFVGERLLHEGKLFLHDASRASLEIHSDKGILKTYRGSWHLGLKIIYISLESVKEQEGELSIHLIKPPMQGHQYIGGLGLMILPSDASSKPCAQRILISRTPIHREKYAQGLDGLLKFEGVDYNLGCCEKVNSIQDERAYVFIQKVAGENPL